MSKILDICLKYDNRTVTTKTTNPGKVAEPFIQWVGGKRSLLEKYSQFIPQEYGDYYEPFLGGGAMFYNQYSLFGTTKNYYLSDLNKELILTYTAISENPTAVSNIVSVLSDKHCKDLYYEIRNIDRTCYNNKSKKIGDIWDILTVEELAARFIYLNKTCFNSLYRVNSNGLNNVPIGTSLKKDFKNNGQFENCSKALKNANISLFDYKKSILNAKEKDFVYFDPPYEPVNSTSNFVSYTQTGFNFQDQTSLKHTVDELTRKGVYVLVSNSNSKKIIDLYKDYDIEEFLVNRTLSSKIEERKNSTTEILITNKNLLNFLG
jgi:DNA adenine methylase